MTGSLNKVGLYVKNEWNNREFSLIAVLRRGHEDSIDYSLFRAL
jgi:hypothetical protein